MACRVAASSSTSRIEATSCVTVMRDRPSVRIRPRLPLACATLGTVMSTARPPSSLRRAVTRPIHRLDEARDDRQADPRPAPRALPLPGHAVELLEEARQGLRRHARPTVLDRDPDPILARSQAEIRIGAPGPAYFAALSRVLLRTWPMNTSSTRIGGRSGSTWTSTGRSPRAAAARRTASATTSLTVSTTRVGRSSPASTRLMSSRFVTSRLSHSASRSIDAAIARRLSARPIDRRIHERAGGRPDRRERRAQVVRDRVEQGGLQRFAPPRHLRRRRLAGEPIAFERPTELVRGRGEDSRLARIGVTQGPRPPTPQRPELPVPGGDRDPIGDHLAVSAARLGESRRVHADPLGGFVAGTTSQHDMDRSAWSRTRIRDPCRRPRSLPGRSTPVTSASRRGRSPRPHGGRPERPASRGDREADVEQRACLALAGQGPCGTVALLAGEASDDRPEDQQQEQVQPLRRVADGEGVTAAR